MKNLKIKIVPYKAEYERAFVELNRAWIEKYFKIEPADTAIFNSPEKTVIRKGGFIFCALVDGNVAGVCALQKISTPKYEYELAKLAVEPRYRGRVEIIVAPKDANAETDTAEPNCVASLKLSPQLRLVVRSENSENSICRNRSLTHSWESRNCRKKRKVLPLRREVRLSLH